MLGDERLGQLSSFEAVAGKGVKCKVSGLEKVPAVSRQSSSNSTTRAIAGIDKTA